MLCVYMCVMLCARSVGHAIVIREKPNHFIFTVESTGALPPEEIVTKALRVLQQKIEVVRAATIQATHKKEAINAGPNDTFTMRY